MKQIRILVNGLVACALALAMVSTASAQVQGKAKVVRLKGSARYTTGNNVWQPLKPGDVIKPGTIIQTSKEKGDFVDLVLGDGNAPMASSNPSTVASTISYQPKIEQNFVRIWENSLLGVDKLTTIDTGADTVSETQLDLKAGHIFGSVKKMSAASKYEVKIPNGVAGIRGTVYDITAEGVVKVSAGSVVLAYVGPDGAVVTQVVMGGQQFDARTGQIGPLAQGDLQFMMNIEAQARAGGGMRGDRGSSDEFTFDHTLYHVSPIHGHHFGRDPDHDGDNDSGHGPGSDTDDDAGISSASARGVK